MSYKRHESDAISLHDLPLSENMNNFEINAMRSVATIAERRMHNELKFIFAKQYYFPQLRR